MECGETGGITLAEGLKIEAQAHSNGGSHRQRLPAKPEENRGTTSQYGPVAATESLWKEFSSSVAPEELRSKTESREK